MLRLEIHRFRKKLTLRLDRRRGFFSPLMLCAISLALLLHGAGYLLFSIASSYPSTSYLFPSTELIIEKTRSEIALADEGPLLIDALSAPPLEMSFQSAIDEILPRAFATNEFDPRQELMSPSLQFELEEQIFDCLDRYQSPSTSPKLQLVLSENLRARITSDLDLDAVPNPGGSAIYQLQIDNRTGAVIHVRAVEKECTDAFHKACKEMLFNLRFSSHDPFVDDIGYVEFFPSVPRSFGQFFKEPVR